MTSLSTRFRYVAHELLLIFRTAGPIDRVWTRVRIKLADHSTRSRLLDRFHERWERGLLAKLDQDSQKLERESSFRDVAERRREYLQPKLDWVRNNKAALLYPQK
jgi:hypothetical protein